MIENLSSVKKGQAAELIFQARCLLNGLDCYPTTSSDNKIDMIVGPSFKKVQVKMIGTEMNVRKVKCNSKSNVKVYHYTADDIDCFAGVAIDTLDVYIIPIDGLSYRSHIKRSTIEKIYTANDLSFFTLR